MQRGMVLWQSLSLPLALLVMAVVQALSWPPHAMQATAQLHQQQHEANPRFQPLRMLWDECTTEASSASSSERGASRARSPSRRRRVRNLSVGLLLPEIRRDMDVLWLVQCQEALRMAVESINNKLEAKSATWRLKAKLFDKRFLGRQLPRVKDVWQNSSSSAGLSSLIPGHDGSSGGGGGGGGGGERPLRATDALEAALTELEMSECVALVAVEADELVRQAAPLAGRLGVPFFTTNGNARLRSVFYTTLVRVGLGDDKLDGAVRDVLLEFHWRNATLVYAVNGNDDAAAAALFSSRVEASSSGMVNISKVVRPTVSADGGDPELSDATKARLREIYAGRVRVVVARVHSAILPLLLDYAHRIGLLGVEGGGAGGGKKFTWLVVDLMNGVRLLPPRYWSMMKGVLVLTPGAKSSNSHGRGNNNTGTTTAEPGTPKLASYRHLHRFAERLRARNTSIEQQPWRTKTNVSVVMCPNGESSEVSLHAAYVHDAIHVLAAAIEKHESHHAKSRGKEAAVAATLAWLHRDPRRCYRLPGFTLRPLAGDSHFIDAVKNASRVEIYERVFGCCSGDYSLQITSANGTYEHVARWSGTRLSLRREVKEDKLLRTWGGVFPVDGPIREATVRVLVVPDEPFVVKKPGVANASRLEDFSGVLVAVWTNITRFYGLKYTLHVWNMSDDRSTTSRLLHDGCKADRWDVVLGAISERATRHHYCRFSVPFYYKTMAVIVLRPADSKVSLEAFWGVFRPFDWPVWLVLFSALLVGGAVLAVLDPEGLQTERRGSIVFDAVFFSFSALLGFGEHNVRRAFARLFILCLQFMLLVVLASYTAMLTRLLSVGEEAVTAPRSSLAVTSFSDLVQKRVGFSPGSDSGDYISNLLGSTNHKLVAVAHASLVEPMLLRGDIDVYFTHGAFAAALVTGNRQCRFMAIPMKGARQKFSFVFNPQWPWSTTIDHRLSQLNIGREVNRIIEEQTRDSCKVWVAPTGDLPLTITSILGLFMIAATASVLAVLLKAHYHLMPQRRRRRRFVHFRSRTSNRDDVAAGGGGGALVDASMDAPYTNWCERAT